MIQNGMEWPTERLSFETSVNFVRANPVYMAVEETKSSTASGVIFELRSAISILEARRSDSLLLASRIKTTERKLDLTSKCLKRFWKSFEIFWCPIEFSGWLSWHSVRASHQDCNTLGTKSDSSHWFKDLAWDTVKITKLERIKLL